MQKYKYCMRTCLSDCNIETVKMETNSVVKFQCLLCKEFLNGKLDNNFSEHMEYHNIKFNQEFIFSTFFLSHKGIEKTVEFMLNYCESEAGGQSGTPKASVTSEAVDDITKEEVIVPDIPTKSGDPTTNDITDDNNTMGIGLVEDNDNSSENCEETIKSHDGEKKTEDPVSDAVEGTPAYDDSNHRSDQTQDEDLIETWNLWNEDEIKRNQKAHVPQKNPRDKDETDDEDDDPDFQWESAASKRSIRSVLAYRCKCSLFQISLVGQAKLKLVQMRKEFADVIKTFRMRKRRRGT